MNEFVSWCRHLLVSFLFHALTSLHPPSFYRNDFSTCYIMIMHISTIALNPPLIVGETTVVEGSSLHLFCDGSNSAPQPTLQWISPNGKVVGESGGLTIVTLTRNMAGTYTCVATLPGSTATMNTSVDITILPSKFGIKVFTYFKNILQLNVQH